MLDATSAFLLNKVNILSFMDEFDQINNLEHDSVSKGFDQGYLEGKKDVSFFTFFHYYSSITF